VKISTAAVIAQVAERVGQRTSFSSSQAPLKYPINPPFSPDFLDAFAMILVGLLIFFATAFSFSERIERPLWTITIFHIYIIFSYYKIPIMHFTVLLTQ